MTSRARPRTRFTKTDYERLDTTVHRADGHRNDRGATTWQLACDPDGRHFPYPEGVPRTAIDGEDCPTCFAPERQGDP